MSATAPTPPARNHFDSRVSHRAYRRHLNPRAMAFSMSSSSSVPAVEWGRKLESKAKLDMTFKDKPTFENIFQLNTS
jgi:hypothetical protein